MAREVHFRQRPKRFWRSDWRPSETVLQKLKSFLLSERTNDSRCSGVMRSNFQCLGFPINVHRVAKTILKYRGGCCCPARGKKSGDVFSTSQESLTLLVWKPFFLLLLESPTNANLNHEPPNPTLIKGSKFSCRCKIDGTVLCILAAKVI